MIDRLLKLHADLLGLDDLYILRTSKLPGLCGNTSYLTVAFSFLGIWLMTKVQPQSYVAYQAIHLNCDRVSMDDHMRFGEVVAHV